MRPPAPRFTPGECTVYSTVAETATVTRALRGVGRKVALVPTMGALHAGHRELIRRARRVPGTTVVVSIFVNPLQFGPGEDLDRYPRSFAADVAACREEGAEVVFAPDVAQMYPEGSGEVSVHAGPLGEQLEGAARPGHFNGMLTVVAKLLNIVMPDYAYFGEKDYQQLVLVKRMVRELNMSTRIVGIPTVREQDGLALSSRNVYLTAAQREQAVALSAALAAGAHSGVGGAAAVLAAAGQVLEGATELELDYLQVRGAELGEAPVHGAGRLLIAGRFGGTRLLDNMPVMLGTERGADEPEDVLLRAGQV
ncbi:MAG: pantoate--beta-alanine ligase [Sciscionella sp.]